MALLFPRKVTHVPDNIPMVKHSIQGAWYYCVPARITAKNLDPKKIKNKKNENKQNKTWWAKSMKTAKYNTEKIS